MIKDITALKKELECQVSRAINKASVELLTAMYPQHRELGSGLLRKLRNECAEAVYAAIDSRYKEDTAHSHLKVGDVIVVGNKPPSKGKGNLPMIGRYYPKDDMRCQYPNTARSGLVVLPTRGSENDPVESRVEGYMHEYWYVELTEIRENALIGTWLYELEDFTDRGLSLTQDKVRDKIDIARQSWKSPIVGV